MVSLWSALDGGGGGSTLNNCSDSEPLSPRHHNSSLGRFVLNMFKSPDGSHCEAPHERPVKGINVIAVGGH